MNEDETPRRGRRWLPVLLVTAAAAVALPVSAALAGGDGDSGRSGTTAEQPGFAPVQEPESPEGSEGQRPEGSERDRHDCPEGQQGDRPDGEQGDQGGGAESDTTAL